MIRPALPRGYLNRDVVPTTPDAHEEVQRVRRYRAAWEYLIAAERAERAARIRSDVKSRVRALIDRVDRADPAEAVKAIQLTNPGWRSRGRLFTRRRGRPRKEQVDDHGFEGEELTVDRIDPTEAGVVVTVTVDGEGVDGDEGDVG